jgi:hypothetical protein
MKDEPKKQLYVALALHRWENMHALTPFPQPIKGDGESIGVMFVFDDLEQLREEFPDADWVTVEVVKQQQRKEIEL